MPIARSNLRDDPFAGPKEPPNFDPPVYETAPPYSEHHYRRLALFRELRREVRRRGEMREAKEARRRRKEGRRMTLDELKVARMKKEAAEKVKQEAVEREKKELLAKAKRRREALESQEPCECTACKLYAASTTFKSPSDDSKVTRDCGGQAAKRGSDGQTHSLEALFAGLGLDERC